MSRPAGESDDDDEYDDWDGGLYRFRRPIIHNFQRRVLSPNDKLFEAVNANDVAAAEAAIAEGADVHCRKDDSSPIIDSALRGHFEVMELLIEQGANVNDDKQMSSVMMCLCESAPRNEEALLKCFRLLHEHGADTLKTSWMKSTCLIQAVRFNHLILVAPLIESGCDVNAADCDGYTAIAIAVERENLDMVKLLMEKGANTNVIDRRGERLIDKPQVHTNRELAALLGITIEEEVELVRKPVLSPFKLAMLEAPNKNDRLHGYHADAVPFVRAVGSHDLAEKVARGNVQLGHVFTWNVEEWKESGVHVSYYHKKIALCVKKYHERQWNKNVIQKASSVVVENEVDPFRVVLFLFDFLRMTHISSTTSLYMLKNLSPPPSEDERRKMTEGIKEILGCNSQAKKQLHILKLLCTAVDSATNSAPPDLVSSGSHERNPNVKLLVYRVVLAAVFELGLLPSALYRFSNWCRNVYGMMAWA